MEFLEQMGLEYEDKNQKNGKGKGNDKDKEEVEKQMKASELKVFESKESYQAIPTTIKHKIVVHESECTAIAFNPLGDMIATAGADQ